MSFKSISKGKLQDLGEMVSDNEIISINLNALTDEKGNLISCSEEEVIPFIKLWSLCKEKEYRLKKQSKKISNKRDQSMIRRKGKFGNIDPTKKKKNNMAKEICYGCQKIWHYIRYCPKCRTGREEDYIKEVKEIETKNLKKEEEI